VLPNLAIIEEFRKQDTGNGKQGMEVFYIGEKNGPEEELVAKSHVPFYGIRAGKIRRYWDFKNFIDIFKIPLGIFEALRILRKLKPDLVFAKGGYVSFPVVLAARFLRIPIWLHESDVSPGLATRMCARFAERVWISFEESRKRVQGTGYRVEIELVGNPIRREILEGEAKEGYRLTGFSPHKPVLLIMGGSSGARSLNELVYKILPELFKKTQVIHITGSTALPLYRSTPSRYRSFKFLNTELPHIYAITDLAISRAGSGSIFELLALKKPMILIPLPKTASRGDQIENARIFEQHGWAISLDQNTLTPKEFLKIIQHFLKNQEVRKEMSERQAKAKFTNAAQMIAEAMRKIS
jgi:UDP-N-acetylglucosamine--N-acetylmuramyl-(pentapeptide) pyrophosphoryl-undecaprenol N-acetylglucosamine transferase